jgi:hypothetical protein
LNIPPQNKVKIASSNQIELNHPMNLKTLKRTSQNMNQSLHRINIKKKKKRSSLSFPNFFNEFIVWNLGQTERQKKERKKKENEMR